MATTHNAGYVEELTARLSDKNPVVKYWAATGCTFLGKKAQAANPELLSLLKDQEPAVRIAAAEVLNCLGEVAPVIPVLTDILQHSDNQPAVCR